MYNKKIWKEKLDSKKRIKISIKKRLRKISKVKFVRLLV